MVTGLRRGEIGVVRDHRECCDKRCAGLDCVLEGDVWLFSPALDCSEPWPLRALTQRYGRLAKSSSFVAPDCIHFGPNCPIHNFSHMPEAGHIVATERSMIKLANPTKGLTMRTRRATNEYADLHRYRDGIGEKSAADSVSHRPREGGGGAATCPAAHSPSSRV